MRKSKAFSDQVVLIETRLHDLPEEIIHRIFRHLTRSPPQSPFNDPPVQLLALSATSTHFRKLVSTFCTTLHWPAQKNWPHVAAWLRLSAKNLRDVAINQQFRVVGSGFAPAHDCDFLPASFFLTNLAFSKPNLRALDLSGINLYSNQDVSLLRIVLVAVRETLHDLTLLDAASKIKDVCDAVAEARLYELKKFHYRRLRSDCRVELVRLLTSLHPSHFSRSPKLSVSPQSLHLALDVISDSLFFAEPLPADICHRLTEFTISPTFEYESLPTAFIRDLKNLRVLTLRCLVLEKDDVCDLLSSLAQLKDLHIEICKLPGDFEPYSDRVNRDFDEVLKASSKVLTSLWLPERHFNKAKISRLAECAPPLKELGLAFGSGDAQALHSLLFAVKDTLTGIRLCALPGINSGMQPIKDQSAIVKALTSAPLLTKMEFYYLNMSMKTWKQILRKADKTLTIFHLDANSNSGGSKGRITKLVGLFSACAEFNPCLRRFSIEVGEHPRHLADIRCSSPLGRRLMRASKTLLNSCPYLQEKDIDITMSLCLYDYFIPNPLLWV